MCAMTNMDNNNSENTLPENGSSFEDDEYLPASPDEIGRDLHARKEKTQPQASQPAIPESKPELGDDLSTHSEALSASHAENLSISPEDEETGLAPSEQSETISEGHPTDSLAESELAAEAVDETAAEPPTELLPSAYSLEGSDAQENTATDSAPEEAEGAAALPVDTHPIDIGAKPKRKRFRWLLPTLLGILALALIAAISAFSGYQSGIGIREAAAGTQAAAMIQEQFVLGVQDLEQGQYFRARQRFEYVINLDSEFPGAQEKLAEALYHLNTTATPTLVPTATLTPTPDLRGVQELFDQASQHLANGEWTSAIESLLSLRQSDPAFRTVEVDGMLFLALRNRGRDKIIKEADLEGGIYDLTLAERFGLLDAEAQGLLTWTSLYITGASFWKIDWGQAASYFGQVAANLPHLMDKSGLTASQRYRTALIEYGYQLADQKQWCKSAEQFRLALDVAYDAETENNFNIAAGRCEKQNNPQQPQQPQSTAAAP